MTAAINTPGLRYRSFGNDLPRPPAALPAESTSFPLLSDAMPQAAVSAEPMAPPPADSPEPPAAAAAPAPAEEPIEEDLPFAGQNEAPAAAPEPEPEAPGMEAPGVEAPGIDWAALAAAAPPAPEVTPPTLLAAAAPPAFAPGPSLLNLGGEPPAPPPAAATEPGFRLLEAIGHVPAPALETPPQRAGTLAMLRGGAPSAGGLSDLPLLNPPAMPRRPGADGAPGQLPAHAVTVPLAEVMRLIASGAPPVSSPFDAFRAALRSSGAS